MYSANLSATLFSLQPTAPFSVVPRVIAFLCTVTNCRLIRCSSDRVTIRGGSLTTGLTSMGRESVIEPPRLPDALCSAIKAATIAVVVASRVRNASVGALGTYWRYRQHGARHERSQTCRLGSRVGWLHIARGDGLPDLVLWDVCVCPWDGEQRRVPSNHGRRFLVAQEQITQAIGSISKHCNCRQNTNVSGAYLSASGRARFHSSHCSWVATTYSYWRMAVSSCKAVEQATHRAHSQLEFPCRTVHLIAEAFNVIHCVDDENGVLRHLPLHRSEQSTSGRFL